MAKESEIPVFQVAIGNGDKAKEEWADRLQLITIFSTNEEVALTGLMMYRGVGSAVEMNRHEIEAVLAAASLEDDPSQAA